jgi:hypothetical protein
MTGVGLDSINKPGKNLTKVVFMVVINVLGDLLAVFIFKSLLAVAIASVVFTFIGVAIGFYYLDKELKLSFSETIFSGTEFYKEMYRKVRKNL